MTYQEINSNLSIDNLPNETFKDIPNYEGLYQVSNLGRVKSLSKKCGFRNKSISILTTSINKRGYVYITLLKNSIPISKTIHRLVMLVFKGKSDLQCNHIDGNKQNNNLNNLEYCTGSENIKHSYKLGLQKINYELLKNNTEKVKVKIGQYDLNNNLLFIHNSIMDAARKLNTHYQCLTRCLSGERKKHKNFIWKRIK